MEINKRIGDYEILDEIGRGGMGKVFRVRNVLSDRVDAMKVLLPDLVENQDLAARFLREIKVLAALNHPNIAALRTALTVDNQLVMIMEYVEGQTLAQRLRHGPIATGNAIAYLEQVLEALDYAHQQHVVHRDIKPANMMLTPAGVVKLMDFGIARAKGDQTLTAVDTTTGSLGYMSPEQVHGKPTDGRSDLYSVGISLYEMVTGERPFKSNSDFAVMLAQVNEQPRPPIELQPTLSPALNQIILKAIEKDPAARFQTAEEFRQALLALPGVRGQSASNTDTVTWPAALPMGDAGIGAAMPTGTGSPNSGESNHPRTMLDTKTPAMPSPIAARATPPPPSTPKRSGASHPVMFVILGGLLVIGALVGTGLYLGRAEAGPERAPATSAPTEPAAPSTPDAAATPTPPDATAGGTAAGATPVPAATTPDAAPPEPAAAAPRRGHCRRCRADICGPARANRGDRSATAVGARERQRPRRHRPDSAVRQPAASRRQRCVSGQPFDHHDKTGARDRSGQDFLVETAGDAASADARSRAG